MNRYLSTFRLKQLFCLLLIFSLSAIVIAGDNSGKKFKFGQMSKLLSAQENQAGPLAGNENFAPASEIVLLWGAPEPGAEPGSSDPDRATMQIMSFIRDQPNLPVDERLIEKGTHTSSGQFGVDGNENMVVVTGDMNGDGFDDIVSAWESPDGRVFLMLSLIDSNTLEFIRSTNQGVSLAGLPTQETPDSGQIRLTTGDFLGDGRDEIAVAYDENGKVLITVWKFADNGGSLLQLVTGIDDEAVAGTGDNALFDIAAADLNQDGDKELMLVGVEGSIYLKVYDFDESGALVAKLRATPGYTVSGDIIALAADAGDFDADGREEVGIGVSSHQSGELFASAHFVHTNLALDEFLASSANSLEISVNPSGNLRAGSAAAGDLNADGADELVVASGNKVMIFGAQSSSDGLVPVLQDDFTGDGSEDDQAYYFTRDYIDVADVDRDRKEEVIFLGNAYNFGGQDARQSFHISIWGNTAQSGIDMALKGRRQSYLDETVSDNLDFRRHYAVAFGDFNGDGIRAGTPRRFSKTEIVQPLVILNAPPVHFDVLGGVGYDLNSCFDTNGCPKFAATYDRQQASQEIMTTEMKSSWAISATVSGEANTATVAVSASVTARYGEDFSKIQGSSQKTTVTINVDAIEDDQIYAIVSDYDIWEYPLFDEGQLVAYVAVTVPKITEARWFPSNSWSAFSYIPDHEVGNILSYREFANFNQNGFIREKIKGNLAVDEVNSFSLSATSDFLWTMQFTDFATNGASEGQTYGLDASASVEVGRDFGLFGAKVSVELNGSYTRDALTSHTSNVTDALSLKVSLGAIDRSIGEIEYIVTPFAYWAQNGAIVIDYAARPELSPPGFPDTWWQEQYGQQPDPALTLPFRLFPEKGRPLQDPARRYQTKEIVFDPRNPKIGDEVLVTTRVHNYSLLPTAGPVALKFYIGDPDQGGALIASTSGDSEFFTDEFIRARDTSFVQFRWTVPPSVDRDFVFDGEFVRVYAVIDADDQIAEIHEDNNKGWNALQISGVMVTSAPASELHVVPNEFELFEAFPNPFNPSTQIQYALPEHSLVRLSVYDVQGRRVAILVNATQPAGKHTVSFDAKNLATGVYFYRLTAGAFQQTKKILLVK
ncbi:MAG: T9SS type A sorting domain-containing protein [Calditrichaeota bacterium]|nr:T9SS type A sorting domain-containing protein [Calditrichota bacterium]